MATFRTPTRGVAPGSGDNPFNITLPTGVAENDILVLTLYIYTAGANYSGIVTPTGWTLANLWQAVSGSDYDEIAVYWIRRGASNPSLTVTRTHTSFAQWSCDAIVGCRTTGNPYSAQTLTTVGSRANPDPGSVATAAGETVYTTVASAAGNTSAFTAPANHTIRQAGAAGDNCASSSRAISSGSSEDPGAYGGTSGSGTCGELTWSLVDAGGGSSAALAGTPAAVAAVTGTLLTKIAAAVASLASATPMASLSSSIALAGPVLVVATPAGTLSLQAQLGGAALAQTAVAAALSTVLRLLGSAGAQATPAGALTGGASLAGAAAAQTSAWATPSAYGPPAADGSLGVERQTSGTTTAADGLLGAVFPPMIAGAAAASATPVGTLHTPLPVAGSAAAQATPAGTLINWGSFTLDWTAVPGAVGYRVKVGLAPGVYEPARQRDVGNVLLYAVGGLTPDTTYYFTVCALDAQGNEGATATEISGIPDPVGAPHNLTGAVISAAVATAAMTTQIPLAGTVQIIVAVAGALQNAGITLAGQAAAQASASGQITTAIRPAGAALSVATVQGALNTAAAALAGLAAAQSTANGSLTVTLALSGAALSQALVSAGLLTQIAAQAAAQAQATPAGTLSGTPAPLGGASLASALAAGDLTVQIRLSGAALAVAAVSGGLDLGISLAGLASAAASGGGVLQTEIRLAGGVAVIAAPIGTLHIATSVVTSRHIARGPLRRFVARYSRQPQRATA